MISWKNVQEQFPWSIIIFTGGAFALVKGVEVRSVLLQLSIKSYLIFLLLTLGFGSFSINRKFNAENNARSKRACPSSNSNIKRYWH